MKLIKIEREILNDDLCAYVVFSMDTKEIYDKESVLRFLERDKELREITSWPATALLYLFFGSLQKVLLERFHWRGIGFFLLYALLSSCIFLFDVGEVNVYFYHALTAIHIPVRSEYGWNLTYFLALMFNLINFFILITKYRVRWIKGIIKYDSFGSRAKAFYIKYIYAFMFCLMLLATYVIPAHSGGDCTGLRDMCFLYTKNMFLYSMFLCYAFMHSAFYFLYMFAFAIYYRQCDIKLSENILK